MKSIGKIIKKLKEFSDQGFAFRFQPEDANVDDYSSMDYGDEDSIDGVWAFPSAFNAIRDLYDPEGGYADDIEKNGEVPELVVLEGNQIDGPEDFVIVQDPKIIYCVLVSDLRDETDLFYDEDENEIDEEFLDWLSFG